MKKTLLTLTATAVLLGGTAEAKQKPGLQFGKAEKVEKREAAAQMQAIEYLPQNGERHGWDGSAWQHQEDLKFTYTSNNPLETVHYVAGDTAPVYKEVTLYDQGGHEVGYEMYTYGGAGSGIWTLTGGWKEVHTHGPNNRIDESIQEHYDATAQAWLKEDKTIYTYDGNGNLLTETYQEWDGSAWVNEDREVYTYNGSVLTELREEEYNGTSWEPYYRYTDITWYNQAEFQVTSAIGQEMISGNWVNEERINATYGANDSYVEEYDEWDGTQWVVDGRYTENIDSKGNETDWKYENYVNSAWQIEDAGEYTYTYDGDKMLERIAAYWDQNSQAIVNSSKEIYSNFISYNTGVSASANVEGIKFYPNPVNDVLNISIEGDAYNTVVVADLSGRIVSATDIKNEQQVRLDLSALESGIYILKLNGQNTSATQRIVKK